LENQKRKHNNENNSFLNQIKEKRQFQNQNCCWQLALV